MRVSSMAPKLCTMLEKCGERIREVRIKGDIREIQPWGQRKEKRGWREKGVKERGGKESDAISEFFITLKQLIPKFPDNNPAQGIP